MATTTPLEGGAGGSASGGPVPREIAIVRTRGDRIFYALAKAGGAMTLIILLAIGGFLLKQAWPAFKLKGLSFFTTFEWQIPPGGDRYGIAAILYWTFVNAVIALVIAVPVAIATALFITEYAPVRIKGILTSFVDLLAAVPSLIYGMWGAYLLQPHLVPIARWLGDHLAFIPFFKPTSDTPNYTSSALVAGVVVSLMVLPICTAVMREVFSQAPPGEKEGALALGGTRWGMIRMVVLPFGRGGIIGGSMLGLGRALGETIAIALLISPLFIIRANVIESGSNGIAPLIALNFGAGEAAVSNAALMAAGVVLFTVTLLVNTFAAMIVARSRSGVGVEI